MDNLDKSSKNVSEVSENDITSKVDSIAEHVQSIYQFDKPTSRAQLILIAGVLDTIFPISYEIEGKDDFLRIPKSTLENQVQSFWEMQKNLENLSPEFLSRMVMDCRLATFVLSSILNTFGINNSVVLFQDHNYHPHLIVDLGDEGLFRYSKIPQRNSLLPVRFYDKLEDYIEDLKVGGHKVFKSNLQAIKCLDIYFLSIENGYIPKEEDLQYLI